MASCEKNRGCDLFFKGVCQGLCGQPAEVFVAAFKKEQSWLGRSVGVSPSIEAQVSALVDSPPDGAGLSSTAPSSAPSKKIRPMQNGYTPPKHSYKAPPYVPPKPRNLTALIRTRKDYMPA